MSHNIVLNLQSASDYVGESQEALARASEELEAIENRGESGVISSSQLERVLSLLSSAQRALDDLMRQSRRS